MEFSAAFCAGFRGRRDQFRMTVAWGAVRFRIGFGLFGGADVRSMLPTRSMWPVIRSPDTTGPTPSGVPVKTRSPGRRW
jgi:hypothetical protein